MRIIIVDDDKNIRQTLSWLLMDEGHEVDTCTNGEDAIEITVEQKYDIMFMDLKMPGIGGLEALEQVLLNQPQLKVFMISGQADLSAAVRATKIGAYDFLEKPLNPEKVLLEIKKIKEQEKARNQIKELEKLVDIDYQMIGESPPVQRLRDCRDWPGAPAGSIDLGEYRDLHAGIENLVGHVPSGRRNPVRGYGQCVAVAFGYAAQLLVGLPRANADKASRPVAVVSPRLGAILNSVAAAGVGASPAVEHDKVAVAPIQNGHVAALDDDLLVVALALDGLHCDVRTEDV